MKILLLILSFIYILPAQQIDTTKQVNQNRIKELQADLKALINNPDLASAGIGISILSLESGEFFFNYNENKNFLPASTLKILTSAAALKYLGPEFRFNTAFYLDGEIDQGGVFRGNVILRGNGDPSLNKAFYSDPFSFMDKFIDKLDSLGIKSIRGNLIGDDEYFDEAYYPSGWALDDLQYEYSSQVNALSVNGNSIDITISPGDSIGLPGLLDIYPENSYAAIVNLINTVEKNEVSGINHLREYNTNLIEIVGDIAYDSLKKNKITLRSTIENPTLFLLNVLKEKFEKRNIYFRGLVIDGSDYFGKIDLYKLTPLYDHISPPLSEIIKLLNSRSDNLAAEMVLKTIGKEMTGDGNFANGLIYIREYLQNAGIPKEKVFIADGSGLSRLNLFAPKYQIDLLAFLYRGANKEVFLNSLARPGKEGTLKRRMKNSLAEVNVYAKTGSMNSVSCLCGYVMTRDKEMLAFSIMINNFTGPPALATNLQDLICMRLASFTRKN